MGQMKDGKGYIFPVPIDPGEYACIQVYVPRHTLYLGAFWRAYEFFTQWSAWARDDDHTGKDVAALWKIGFDRARTQFLAGGACLGDDVIIRMNPDTCRLEYRGCDTDDPDQWYPIDGPTSSTTYDPRIDPFPVKKPPLYDPPTDACNSAVNTMHFMRSLIGKIIVWWNLNLGPSIGSGLTVPSFLVDIERWLGEFMYNLLLNYVTVAETVYYGVQAAPLAAISWLYVEDDFNAFDWDDFVCAILPAFNPDGTFNHAAIDGVQTTIESHYGENQMWYFFGIYWGFIASGPLQDYARSFFGITDGVCPCGWHYEADFTASDGGWEGITGIGVPIAIYAGGWNDNAGALYIQLVDPPETGTVNHVKIIYDSDAAWADGSFFRARNGGATAWDLNATELVGTDLVAEWSGLTEIVGDRWWISANGLSGNMKIKRVILDGTS